MKSELPTGTKHVLLALGLRMNPRSAGAAWPSQAQLARDTGMSERSVRDHVAKAVDEGWLEKQRRGSRGLEYRPAMPVRHRRNPAGEKDSVTGEILPARKPRHRRNPAGEKMMPREECHRQESAGVTGEILPVYRNSKENSKRSSVEMETVVDVCRLHLWLADSPPGNPIENDLSVFKQLAKEFDAETVLGIIPMIRGNFRLGDQPVSLRLLNAKKNRGRVRELVHRYRQAQLEKQDGREASLVDLVEEIRA